MQLFLWRRHLAHPSIQHSSVSARQWTGRSRFNQILLQLRVSVRSLAWVKGYCACGPSGPPFWSPPERGVGLPLPCLPPVLCRPAAHPTWPGNTRRKVDWLADAMNKADFTVSFIHAEMPKGEREKVSARRGRGFFSSRIGDARQPAASSTPNGSVHQISESGPVDAAMQAHAPDDGGAPPEPQTHAAWSSYPLCPGSAMPKRCAEIGPSRNARGRAVASASAEATGYRGQADAEGRQQTALR